MDRPPVKTHEHDVDYLFIEEIHVNKDFRDWLLEQFNHPKASYKLIGAWISTVKNGGETDIAIGIKTREKKTLLLIEDKIYAPEQHNQSERYHERGKERVEEGEWDEYHTAILSPEKYLEDYDQHEYEHEITYEQLLNWIKENSSSPRSNFQEKVIEEGIEKARTGYQRTTDEITDDFYRYYEDLARSEYPNLEYSKPDQVASGNTWIRFPNPLPKNATIIHKSGKGFLDLQISDFEGNSLDFQKQYNSSLDEVSVHDTGESVSVRMHVPKLDASDTIVEPDNYREEVIKALDSASKLVNWYIENYH